MGTPTKLSQDLYDSLRTTQRSVDALIQLRDILPEGDKNSDLVSCLVDGLESNYTDLRLICLDHLAGK